MSTPARRNQNGEEFHHNYILVTRLCRTGLRPPAIRTMVSSIIPDERIFAVYRMMTGQNPPQGQLPAAVDHSLNSPRKRLNATAVLLLDQSYRLLTPEERFLRVYYSYQALMGDEAMFDATRIWSLCRWSAGDMIRLAHCAKCGSSSATSHKSLRIAAHCPFCSLAAAERDNAAKTATTAITRARQTS